MIVGKYSARGAHGTGSGLTALVLMLFQERVEKLVLAPESCLAKPGERLGQINMAVARGGVQNAERSHYCEPLGFSGGDSGAIIHEDCVNLEGISQDNRRSLSTINPQ